MKNKLEEDLGKFEEDIESLKPNENSKTKNYNI